MKSDKTGKISYENYVRYIRSGDPGCFPKFMVGRHHKEIFTAVDQILNGDISVLIIEMPPRHGKSESISRTLPSYIIGAQPKAHVLIISGLAPLAEEFLEANRLIMTLPAFQAISPTRLRKDTVNEIFTTEGGRIYATHVTGAIGRGGDVIIVDDLITDSIFSEKIQNRDRIWRKFSTDIMSRGQPMSNGKMPGIIVIGTRFHPDDHIGRLKEALQNNPAHSWRKYKILSFPALSSLEEPLWPEMFKKERLLSQRAMMSPVDWECIYQQNPNYITTSTFDVRKINYYDTIPQKVTLYGGTDFAFCSPEESNTGDHTAHVIVALDEFGNFFVVDGFYGQVQSPEGIVEMVDLMEKWRPLMWFSESGISRRALEPYIALRMQEKQAKHTRLEWVKTVGVPKETRAIPLKNIIATGRLFLPYTSLGRSILLELENFGYKRKFTDDLIDALACIAQSTHKTKVPWVSRDTSTYNFSRGAGWLPDSWITNPNSQWALNDN